MAAYISHLFCDLIDLNKVSIRWRAGTIRWPCDGYVNLQYFLPPFPLVFYIHHRQIAKAIIKKKFLSSNDIHEKLDSSKKERRQLFLFIILDKYKYFLHHHLNSLSRSLLFLYLSFCCFCYIQQGMFFICSAFYIIRVLYTLAIRLIIMPKLLFHPRYIQNIFLLFSLTLFCVIFFIIF